MSIKDGPGEGSWSVFAAKIMKERDNARENFLIANNQAKAYASERDQVISSYHRLLRAVGWNGEDPITDNEIEANIYKTASERDQARADHKEAEEENNTLRIRLATMTADRDAADEVREQADRDRKEALDEIAQLKAEIVLRYNAMIKCEQENERLKKAVSGLTYDLNAEKRRKCNECDDAAFRVAFKTEKRRDIIRLVAAAITSRYHRSSTWDEIFDACESAVTAVYKRLDEEK
jgi:hypothetical protein